MTKKKPWISIPNSFLILWISIPVSCGSVSQTHFWFCGSVSLYPVDQYPKSISKRPLTKWSNSVQTVGFSEGCTGVAQGLHRGRRGSAQRAHREHAEPILPNFFAFQAREMKFGEQNGIMTSESFQIFGGTRSFTNSLWHTVIYKLRINHGNWWKMSVAHGHFKFSVAHGHFKFSVAHGHFKFSATHSLFKFSVAPGHLKFSVAHCHFNFHFSKKMLSFSKRGSFSKCERFCEVFSFF